MAQDPSDRRLSFPPGFRLKRKRLIRPLFDRHRQDVQTVTSGCIRLVFRQVAADELAYPVPLQIGFTTGRGVKRAVDRNTLKRHMREAFRHHQHILLDACARRPGTTLTIMVIFRGNLDAAARQIPRHVPTAFSSLVRKIQEGYTPN